MKGAETMANFTPQEIEEMLREFFDVTGKRQYIGARYVPVFGRKGETSISWDNSKPYEPLTIVLYRNNSYTSRTYVPAGTPITDTEFWAQTGNYNAQVESYRQETIALSNRMDYLENIIPNDDFTPTNTVKKFITDSVNEAATNIESEVDTKIASKIPWPLTDKLGTAGQVLRTNADNTTTWVDPNLPSEELMRDAVNDWLESNPEVTQPDVTILQQQNHFWPITPMQLKNDALNEENTIQLQTLNGIWNTLEKPSDSTLYVTITPLLYIPPFTKVTVFINDKNLYYRARFKELQNNTTAWFETTSSHSSVRKSDNSRPGTFTNNFDYIIFQTKYVGAFGEIDVRNADTSALSPESVILTAKMENTFNDMLSPIFNGVSSVLSEVVNSSEIAPSNTNVDFMFSDNGGGRALNGYTMRRYYLSRNTNYILRLAGEQCRAMLLDTGAMDGTHYDQPLITTAGSYVINTGNNVALVLATESTSINECGVFAVNYNGDIPNNYCIFYGNIFFVKNKVVLYRSGYAFGVSNGLIQSMNTAIPDNTYVELDTLINNVQFVVFTGTEIVMRTQSTLLASDIPIAMIYTNAHLIYPLAEGTIAQELPIPSIMHKRSGTYAWFDKASSKVDYITRTKTNVYDFGTFYRFGDTFGTYMLGQNNDRDSIQPVMRFIQNQTSIDNKKILTIGDSFTNRGWYQQRVLTYNSSVEFVGTRMTQNNNLLAEGYSGLRTSQVFGAATLTPAGSGEIPNPFYDPNLNRCTLEYYCRTTNIIPDYVVIEFMLNENNSDDYYNYIQDFIDSIKSYDQNIIVYVMQMKSDVSRLGSANGLSGERRGIQNQCLLNSFKFTDCVLIPCWFILTDEYDYNHTQVAYGVGNINIDVLSDGVHPSESTGFAKLGDQLYNYLGVSNV